ncbi:hypothetical protein BK218_12360 [Brucella melitensis]|nr:hypothetical protein BK218_12360 [Brucella melitensis]
MGRARREEKDSEPWFPIPVVDVVPNAPPPPPITRHATIFSMIDTLEPGEVPEIVNDHDPVPLRNQLEHRNPGAFSWVYKETGPLWRVEIGRRKVHASDHECTCGNH